MKMIAVNEIVRGPKREVIAPKSAFEATKEERDELLALGAAVDAEAEEKPKVKGKKADTEADDSVM
jgi:hypothetical protein